MEDEDDPNEVRTRDEINYSLRKAQQKYIRSHLRNCVSTEKGRRKTRNFSNHTSFMSVIR